MGGQRGFRHNSIINFNKICDSQALFAAWQKFRRGKRLKTDVQIFERHLEENIFDLQVELRINRYQHGPYVPFRVWDPKQRQIHKATVRDRLVHQAVVTSIEPLFEEQFIYDSFSCRKGKGTHAGVRRLRRFLRQASLNDSRTVYVLKCDIRQFFASVDHSLLLDLLGARIADCRTLELLKVIIDSFATTPGKGIPLGNLTSQLFANVYMHEFDWFVKHQLRQKYYVRYCDDFVIVDRDRQHLLDLTEPISDFLNNRLALTIHPKKVIVRSWDQGVDFLGYVLKPHCTLLRTKTKKRMLKRVDSTNLSSYLGLCSHANTYELTRLIQTKAGFGYNDQHER